MNEIKLKIRSEADLYNPLDPDQVMLSDAVTGYIIRKYQEMNHTEEFCLHIISDEPVNEDRVRENIRTHMRHEQEIGSRELKLSTGRQIRLFVIGIAFISVWLFAAANTGNIAAEVLSIIGSFAVWEAADIWIAEKPHIRLRKMKLKILEKTEIRFSETGNDQTEKR